MRPLDSAATSGVIAPEIERATDSSVGGSTVAQAGDQTATAQAVVPDPTMAIPDLALPQLPEDLPPIEPPEFLLSRRIAEETPAATGLPIGGLPGLSGPAGSEMPDAQDILSGATEQFAGLAEDATAVIGQAAAPAAGIAEGVLGQAQGPLGGTPAAAAASSASGATAAPAALPALPDDPVGALLGGTALSGLPGVDVLFKPILDLLNSMGTGVIGALDPTAILSQSSKIIEMAMSVGKGSLSAVGEAWQSQAASTAQTAGQEAHTAGLETSQRGIDISALTQRAAAVVQQGNAQLTAIASSFATQAVALSPVILTPPAQTALIASATEHLGQAVGVVNTTRGDLAGKTAELNGLVNQLLGPHAPQAAEAAQAVAQNIGEPILAQAQEAMTSTAGLESPLASTGSPSTTAAGLGTGTPGSPGGPGALGALGTPGSPGRVGGVPGLPGTPAAPGTPGAALPPGVLRPGMIPGMPGSTGATPASNSFMGGPAGAAAGQRNNDEEHSRTVESYRSRTGDEDLTGPLGESTPQVIGGIDLDADDDYTQDQFQ